MKRTKHIYYLSAALFLTLVICQGNSAAKGSLDFSLKNIFDGKTYRFAEYKAQRILMVFGSIHCKPCIELIPVLNKIYDENKSSGAMVVGIDIDSSTNIDEIKKFAQEKKIRFPIFIDTKNIAQQNKIFILPTILVIDGNGKEVKRYIGYQPHKVLEKEFKGLKPASSNG